MCAGTTEVKAGDRMRIGFIGAGKVGFSLGRYFGENDVCVSGYYSRNPKFSREAAEFTKIKKVYSEIIQSDIEGKILVHCSRALSSMVFSGISGRGVYGYSIHPICAVSDKLTGYHNLSKVYFTIEKINCRLLIGGGFQNEKYGYHF